MRDRGGKHQWPLDAPPQVKRLVIPANGQQYSRVCSVPLGSSPAWRGTLSGSYQDSTTGLERTRRDSYGLAASLNGRISPRSLLDVMANYSIQRGEGEDSLDDQDAFGLRGQYSWRYRKLLARATLQYTMLDEFSQEEDRTRFRVFIKREF